MLMKMCGGVDSIELSTGVGGGASGSEVMCCNSMLVYVAILQPENKLKEYSDSKCILHALYAWGKISPLIPMCN